MSKFDDLYKKIITEGKQLLKESHIPFSKFFPVKTRDGMDTGWFMGPSDFSGRGRNPMRCSLDPNYIVKRDETILINPEKPGVQIALTSYYKAAQGDEELRQKMQSQFGLDATLDI